MFGSGSSLRVYFGELARSLSSFWRSSLALDWIFLALLGIITAMVGYLMEYVIGKCFLARMWYYHLVSNDHIALQYFVWVGLSVLYVLFSFTFVALVAPQAVGSGIPEMKTILWGIQLKEVLTFRTGIAKVVGLTSALASGMPLGKEGPLVHIASVIATTLSRFMNSSRAYWNESKCNEMLAAACAVGLAVNFSSPVGGVLFSIEVTSSYFASYNYWRGFVSAIFASLANRLLAYWLKKEDTLKAIFQTNFRQDFMFDPHELFAFLLMGVFGGLAGAGFVLIHRKYSLFLRQNTLVSSFLKLNRFIYPTIVSVTIATLYFPPVLGKYLMATTAPQQTTVSLFANFSWFTGDLREKDEKLLSPWKANTESNLFVTLGIYMVGTYILSIVATTIPVPNGSIVPIFSIGAAFGRMIGEAMHIWFPEGISQERWAAHVVPGGYALVGAAAFTAGVTHSISIGVVVCEMTGHIAHIIPIMIAVLMSNAVSCLLQPSFFDSLIIIRNLPFLPNIHSSRNACESFVEDFMVRDVKYIWKGMSYHELKNLLVKHATIKAFPLVDDPEKMILLGSVTRGELTKLLKKPISIEKRLQELERIQRRARIRSYEESMSLVPPHEPSVRRVSLALPRDYGAYGDYQSFSSLSEIASVASEAETVVLAERSETPVSIPLSPPDESKPATDELRNSRFRVTLCPEIVVDPPADEEENEREEKVLETGDNSSAESISQQENLSVAYQEMTSPADVNIRNDETIEHTDEPLESVQFTQEAEKAPTNLTSEQVVLDVEKVRPTLDIAVKTFESSHTGSTRPRCYSLSSITLPPSRRKSAPSPADCSILSTKPILKLNRGVSEPNDVDAVGSLDTHYATVTGTETEKNKQSRFSFDAIFQKSSSVLTKSKLSLNISSLPSSRRSSMAIVDMTAEERESWEESELSKPIDLTSCHIDPAPFQLVERTSLLKVHSIFSLLGMSHAYVTALGKLVGIVALKELREAVECVKSSPQHSSSTTHHETKVDNDNCLHSCFPFLEREKELHLFHGRRITSLKLKNRKDSTLNDGNVMPQNPSYFRPSRQSSIENYQCHVSVC